MALSYIGGKSKIGTWIRNYVPNNIETYVEPFSGMFWVFFKLNTPSFKNLKRVVYNDVNPLNVNLYLCLKNYKKFWDMTQNTPIENKELFDKCKSDLISNLKFEKTDVIISHFLNLQSRPDVKKIILSSLLYFPLYVNLRIVSEKTL